MAEVESLGLMYWTICLALLLGSGCGLVLDSSPPFEVSAPGDGGVEAMVRDSGGVMDAGVDGRVPDAAPEDGGVTDASGRDSSRPDAGGTDAGRFCPGTPCDPLSQCGCDDTDHCVLTDSLAIICEVPGPVPEGQRCDNYWECARALTCAYAGPGSGICAPYCARDADCEDGVGVRCLTFVAGGIPSTVGACSAGCNPVEQSGCEGIDCLLVAVDASGNWATVCGGGGATPVGTPCTYPTDCVPGAACVDNTCQRLCDGATSCGGSYACLPFVGSPSWSGAYGICTAS